MSIIINEIKGYRPPADETRLRSIDEDREIFGLELVTGSGDNGSSFECRSESVWSYRV